MSHRDLRWPAWAAAGLAAAALCAWRMHESAVFGAGEAFHESLTHGEALLHSVASDPGVTYRMPLSGIALSLFRNHLGEGARLATGFVILLAPALLAFQAGLLLAGARAGLLAALLCSLPLGFNAAAGHEEQLYRIILLLTACLAAQRASRPGLAASAGLGLALGAGLLVRSPLFLFPLVLAAWDLVRPGPARDRGPVWSLLVLLCLPFLFLLPWAGLNSRLGLGPVLLEHGRADANIVSAALGLVPTQAGGSLMPSGLEAGEGALSWAVSEVLRHPGRYALGVLARLWFVFQLQPLLILAAAAGAWLNRRRAGVPETALLAAYFIAVHCLLSVEGRYFEPLWPVLAVLASCVPAARGSAKPAARPWLAWGAGAGVLGLALAAEWRVCAYARGGSEEEAFSQALARNPEDPWLWFLSGRRRLRLGEPELALSDLAKAASLEPGHFPFESSKAWAMTAAGRLDADGLKAAAAGWRGGLAWDWSQEEKDFLASALGLLRALALPPRAQASAGVPGLWLEVESAWRGRSGGRSAPADAALEHPRLAMARHLQALAAAWPAEQRLSIMQALAAKTPETGLGRETALLAEDLARADLKAGRKGSGLKVMETLAAANRDPELLARLALLYQEAGHPGRALETLDAASRLKPADSRVANSRGVALSLLGRKAEARREFETAIRLDPGLLAAYLSLGGLQAAEGDRDAALRTFEAGAAASGKKSRDPIARMLRSEADRLNLISQ
ncbi:MAG: hypothetical protein HY924_06215 [Elusimicrobia bacterium]|nr:hypothetical protein [Elusimicrobiota bacterium]